MEPSSIEKIVEIDSHIGKEKEVSFGCPSGRALGASLKFWRLERERLKIRLSPGSVRSGVSGLAFPSGSSAELSGTAHPSQ